MLFRYASSILLVSSALLAQTPDAFEALLARQRMRPDSSGAYQFLSAGVEFEGPWRGSPELMRLRVSGELSFLQLDEAQTKALWSRQRWSPGESRWVILGPDLSIVGSGTAHPTAESLLQALRDAGWKPQSERREAFLREHPDNGNAWQDLFTESLRVALLSGDEEGAEPEKSKGVKAPDPEKDQARFGEVERALRGLMDVEGWEDYFEFSVGLDEGARGFQESALLQPMVSKMRGSLEGSLKARPGDWRLWSAWTELAGPADSPEALLASLEPAPRQPWPPLEAAEPLALAYRRNQDWVGLERCAAAAMTQALQPLVLQASEEGSAAYNRASVAAAWGPYRVEALLRLRRPHDALTVLEECRALGGRWWRRLQLAFSKGTFGGDVEKILSDEDVRALKEIFKQPALKDAPPPAAPLPLRLAVQGRPEWGPDFLNLQRGAAFDVWKPGRELVWDHLSAAEAATFRDRGEGGEDRWLLLRGAELLASGGEIPFADTLSEVLRAHGLPYLAELDAFIKSHPDHAEARGQRVAEVSSHPQTLGLERRLLADFTRTRSGAIFPKDWKPDPELWAPAAKKILPGLEAELRRWPTSTKLWQAWVSWAALHASHPKPGALLRSVAVWKNVRQERSFQGTGPLALEGVMSVSEFLQAKKDWEGLADWCRALWDLGWREALPRFLNPNPRLAQGLREAPPQVTRFLTDYAFRILLVPYADALRNLGRTEELRQLALELDLLQPGLAKRLDVQKDSKQPRPGR